MMRTLFFSLVLILMVSCALEQQTVVIYASPMGQTDGDGTKENPFSTIQDAFTKAEEIKERSANAKITVNLLPGEYYLNETLTIPPSLSGLTIKGDDASKTMVKGSRPLQLQWEKYGDSLLVAKVPEDLEFDQLFVNGTPQMLARYPNYDENGGYWQGYDADALSKERIASWDNPVGTYFHVLHRGRWGGFHYRITGINDDGTPKLEGGHQNNRPSRPHEEFRMVENVFEELDAPGEWYLNKEDRKLYFWPTENIDLQNAKIEVPILKSLFRVVGRLEEPAKNITISDLTLLHTQRTFMEEFEPLLRSDWTIYRGAVVFYEGTENCILERCEFYDLGGNAIMASKYNDNLQIRENHIYDCGASAICFIGDPSAVRSPAFQYGEFVPFSEMDTVPGPKNELYPRNSLVENNLIHRIGRLEKQTAGVQISMAMDITVRHNSIYDVPRAGINIGDGTWGGHQIEKNDVFNTVLETSDHGSFNSWGRDRFWHPNRNVMDSITQEIPDMYTWDAVKTTVIRNNRFRCDHGWDIDLDDGSSNYHIYNNLCLNNGIKLREGFDRVVENNILVNNSLHPHVWFANSQDVFRKNIVQKAYQDVRLEGWGKDLDYNLFPNEVSLMKSQIYDRDANSASGDPQFQDPANLDFSVAPNSPALALGFENFAMDEFGVQSPKLKALAKTPEVPSIQEQDQNEGNSPVVEWLRNRLKSVGSGQEQSAYGLNTPEGVIVLQVWNQSPAVQNNGLKEGDVIIEASGSKVNTVKDFFTVNLEHPQKDTMNLLVMRNQSEKRITIKLK